MGLVEYAKHELDLIGMTEGDDANGWLRRDILAFVELFANQNHSGSSAHYAAKVLDKLLKYEPLSPLTGADDEWFEHPLEVSGGALQNKRYFSVFKDPDGTAYDSNAIVFEDENGLYYTSKDSRVEISFPYTPKTTIQKEQKQ